MRKIKPWKCEKKGTGMDEKNINIRLELEKKLDNIGWHLWPCGCEHYRICNDNKNPTCFIYRHGVIVDETGENKKIFGEQSGGGGLAINLEKCNIEVMEGAGPFVSIVAKTDDHERPAMYLSFYKVGD